MTSLYLTPEEYADRIQRLHIELARTRKAYKLAIAMIEFGLLTGETPNLTDEVACGVLVRMALGDAAGEQVDGPSAQTWTIAGEIMAEWEGITVRTRDWTMANVQKGKIEQAAVEQVATVHQLRLVPGASIRLPTNRTCQHPGCGVVFEVPVKAGRKTRYCSVHRGDVGRWTRDNAKRRAAAAAGKSSDE